jgi:hypothetical protein
MAEPRAADQVEDGATQRRGDGREPAVGFGRWCVGRVDRILLWIFILYRMSIHTWITYST